MLMAYQGSTEAGQAVADVIFGKVNPSGKLPISWPSDAPAVGADFDGTAPSPLGDQPKFFDQLPGTGSGPGHAYNPLYPFGFGLSYTSFSHERPDRDTKRVAHRHRNGRFTVTNTGTRSGTDIVPVYVAQPVSSVVVPPQRLVGFTRVTLGAGQAKSVTVRFPVSALAESAGDINASGPPTVERGDYIVAVGQERHDAIRRRRVSPVHHPLSDGWRARGTRGTTRARHRFQRCRPSTSRTGGVEIVERLAAGHLCGVSGPSSTRGSIRLIRTGAVGGPPGLGWYSGTPTQVQTRHSRWCNTDLSE